MSAVMMSEDIHGMLACPCCDQKVRMLHGMNIGGGITPGGNY